MGRLPDKATKHITKPTWPIGMVKGRKRKVKDGDTGVESWRQTSKGFLRDWDGDPIANNYNKSGLKPSPKHTPYSGRTRKPRPSGD